VACPVEGGRLARRAPYGRVPTCRVAEHARALRRSAGPGPRPRLPPEGEAGGRPWPGAGGGRPPSRGPAKRQRLSSTVNRPSTMMGRGPAGPEPPAGRRDATVPRGYPLDRPGAPCPCASACRAPSRPPSRSGGSWPSERPPRPPSLVVLGLEGLLDGLVVLGDQCLIAVDLLCESSSLEALIY
jgi:hypothetical protein